MLSINTLIESIKPVLWRVSLASCAGWLGMMTKLYYLWAFGWLLGVAARRDLVQCAGFLASWRFASWRGCPATLHGARVMWMRGVKKAERKAKPTNNITTATGRWGWLVMCLVVCLVVPCPYNFYPVIYIERE